jgi:hypothetical protein
MKFIVACQKFFGKKEGQTIQDFITETRQLSEKDRRDLIPELEAALGVKIEG